MNYKIGVDGGGTKTECLLIDSSGVKIASHTAAGCNPSVVGPAAAASILTAALTALRDSAADTLARDGGSSATPGGLVVSDTLLCMAGSRGFWTEFAAGLAGFGQVQAADDSLPILELATHGRPGLALHAGTGSFVAARGPDGAVHYAGGRGWRFDDAASGYDLGARAIARALLEVQGWAPASGISAAVGAHAQLAAPVDASAITRHFYAHADATRHIAGLAPAVLRLAVEGDASAQQIVLASTGGLLDLAISVATQLFPGTALATIPAGLSGHILTNPLVMKELAARSPMPLTAITDPPIEGVRQLLMRL
jgi:N-acetylglucosamine kinase-like BadF-type ATPase